MSTSTSVAIVDDDQSLLELTSGILRDAGFEVHSFSSTVFPKVLLQENPDAVLLDMWMGTERSGFTLAQQLQRNKPEACDLYLMSSDPRVKKWADDIDAEASFVKPLNFEAVIEKIKL